MSSDSEQFSTLAELLHRRALTGADHIVYRWLADGEEESEVLTCSSLETAAISISDVLVGSGCSGKPALLLYPPGLDFIRAFFGCLYAGTIAVPAYPPRGNLHWPRLESIIADSAATTVLTTRSIMATIGARARTEAMGKRLRWITTDCLEMKQDPQWQPRDIQPDSVALLQYTSG